MSLPPGPLRPAALQTLAWLRRPLALLDACRRRYGSRFTLRFVGGRNYVLVSQPDDVKALFQLPQDAFRSANLTMKPFLGEHSLFVVEGDRHRRHRRLIGPPLRGERLHAYAGLIDELVREEVASWPEGRPFAVIDRMRDLTLRLILRAIFGMDQPVQVARLTEVLHQLTSGPTAIFAFIPALHIDLGPHSPWGRFQRLRAELHAMLHDEVRRARAEASGRTDMLARLTQEGVAEGDPLSDDEIVDELVTLLAAGHETSTAALAWAFQWILGDPQIAARVRDEAGAALAGGPLTQDALDRMPYLEAAVLETLRLSPIIPIVPRLLAAETTINDLTVPAGTYLTACAYLTQQDPQLYPEPQQFRPERFIGKRWSPFEFYPFGGGHRFCIGGAFALYEMRAILAVVLAHADLRRPDLRPQKVGRRGIAVTPAAGTPVILEGRA